MGHHHRFYRPVMRVISSRRILMPGTFVSSASKTSIKRKFRELEIHKRRKPIAHLARELNPVIEGNIQYYHKCWHAGMRPVWNLLNHRLLKCVKWENVFSSMPRFVGCGRVTTSKLLCLPTGDWYNHDYFSQVIEDMKSRMHRAVHVRFCGKAGVKFPCLTRLVAILTGQKHNYHFKSYKS